MVQPLHGRPMEFAQPAKDPAHAERVEAAHQFESLLVRQLLQVMRGTVKGGGLSSSEGASGQYLAMFDQVIADTIAAGGGIGLEPMLVQAMSGAEGGVPSQPLPSNTTPRRLTSTGITPPAPPLPGLTGATLKLATAAYGMTLPEGGKQWSREGVLTHRDLASPPIVNASGELVPFNVEQANGYRDAFKCNLFALEAARRAGFEVPMSPRTHGAGFPTSTTITEDAADGALRGDWARPVAPSEVPALLDKLSKGEVGILLSASGTEGRLGHMAVVERIHDIDLDASGNIRHIEFDGWEARKNGAEQLLNRTWNLRGHGEDTPSARNGFGNIEVLALKPKAVTQPLETPMTSDNRTQQANLPLRIASTRPIP